MCLRRQWTQWHTNSGVINASVCSDFFLLTSQSAPTSGHLLTIKAGFMNVQITGIIVSLVGCWLEIHMLKIFFFLSSTCSSSFLYAGQPCWHTHWRVTCLCVKLAVGSCQALVYWLCPLLFDNYRLLNLFDFPHWRPPFGPLLIICLLHRSEVKV